MILANKVYSVPSIMYLKKMKILKLTLLSIFSLTVTSPAIFAAENDKYWFGYSWGGMMSACLAYQFSNMTDAKEYVQIFYEIGEENIKNKSQFYKLKELQQGDSFKNCRDIIAK